ncbi:MAG: hypothetical protein ACI9MC_002662 [Kiritimatiellia bacterium]
MDGVCAYEASSLYRFVDAWSRRFDVSYVAGGSCHHIQQITSLADRIDALVALWTAKHSESIVDLADGQLVDTGPGGGELSC